MSFFSKNLKYLREKSNISRNTLADKLNVNQSTISRWENEDMGVTVDNAYDVARYFNISIADLTGVDLSNTEQHSFDELDLLFSKTKDILNDTERDVIKAVMQNAIEKYENSKKE